MDHESKQTYKNFEILYDFSLLSEQNQRYAPMTLSQCDDYMYTCTQDNFNDELTVHRLLKFEEGRMLSDITQT